MRTFKVILLSIALFGINLNSAIAQENEKFEVGLNYGINSMYKQHYQSIWFKSYFNGSGLQVSTLSKGVINLSCLYALSTKWHLGIDLAYEKIYFEQPEVSNYYLLNDQPIDAYTFGSKINFTYINYPFFKMYSGIGFAYTTIPVVKNNISAHFTGCGIRFGKRLGIHIELGHGYRGKLNAGLNFRI